MRRESSTVVVLVGRADDRLLAEIARSPNVAVARPPEAMPASAPADPEVPPAPAWEPGALALREAARRSSTYVIVPDDPLAGVAAHWRAMWDVPGGSPGAAGFEASAADVVAAWRGKQFELPDYYLVIAPPEHAVTGPDLYLGPLHAARPRRVIVAGRADGPEQATIVVNTLRFLEHGPWWPPLDELLDTVRRFYPGGLGAQA